MLAPHPERHIFEPRPADANGNVTWIHLGDLHMKKAGEQNEIDLGRIIDVQDVSSSPEITLRAKVWSRTPVARRTATLHGGKADLENTAGVLWSGDLKPELSAGDHLLSVSANTEDGRLIRSSIEISVGSRSQQERAAVDQDNAIGAWEERGIFGTQLGPNKNGRKW